MSNSSINIFRRSNISNCNSCIYDSNIGYYVDWPTNNDLNGYDSYSGVTSVTTWDGVFFAVASSSECYLSHSSSISIEASKYDIVKIYMAVNPGTKSSFTATGKIQFKLSGDGSWDSLNSRTFDVTADGDYHLYTINMALSYRWSGTVAALRIYPFVDGVVGSTIHVRYVKVESRSNYACSSRYTGAICDSAYRYEHPCPWIGSPGKSVSAVLSDHVTITENVNDVLFVDIDGYGSQRIQLSPGSNISIYDVANDIQAKLNLVGIGGFFDARCYVTDENRICVESGWHGTDSSVSVESPSYASAAETLGFYSGSTKIASESNGTDPASRYTPAPIRASYYIFSGFLSSSTSDISIPMGGYFPEGGRAGYASVVRDDKISFRNKTLIDINNPINSNGVIGFIAFSGDAFTNTSFRVYRQKFDGTVALIHSVDMSESEDTEDQVFTKEVNLRVKRGDLLGLYSASLHLGASQERHNYSYFLYDGDLSSSSNMPIYGNGEQGLPIYARSSSRATSMSVLVDFNDGNLIESLSISAQSSTIEEKVNLCTVRNGGLNGGPHISGETEEGDAGAPAGSMVNLDALVDGYKADIGGESPTCYPFWEPYAEADKEDYTYSGFHIDFDFCYGVDALLPIKYIYSYFDHVTNIKTFKWEVPKVFSSSGAIKEWGVGWSAYDSVSTDLGQMDSRLYLYENPSVVTASGYQRSYVHTKYRQLFHTLAEPYYARGLRYNVTLDGTNTTNSYRYDYAKFPPAPNPKIEEIEVYAAFYPSFSVDSFVSVESSDDGSNFVVHDDVDVVDTGTRFTIGRPTKQLKITFESNYPLVFSTATAEISEGRLSISGLENDLVQLNPSSSSPSSSVKTIYVTNDSTSTSTFFIDILKEGIPPKSCVLWNKLDTDSSVAASNIGPGGTMHKRESFALRPTNYAYKRDGYVLYKNINGNGLAYLSVDNMSSWGSIGSTISTRTTETYVTNETENFHIYPYVYVALDLRSTYDIDSVSLYSGNYDGFEEAILYSSMDTDNPADIPYGGSLPDAWRADSITNARWCLFRAPSVKPGGAGVRYLYYADIVLDIHSPTNIGKDMWTAVGDKLTNGVSEEGWIGDDEASYYCVDLGWWFDITNVVVGPSVYTGSVNSIEAGDTYSLLDSSYKGSRVAFGYNNTSNPSEVEWSSFDTAPRDKARWVLVANESGSYVDEVIVHVDMSEPDREVSYLTGECCDTYNADASSDFIDTRSGLSAIKATVGNTTTSGVVTYRQDLGIDTSCSPRDSFAFWFYVSNVSVLNSNNGYIRLGTSLQQQSTIQNINLTDDTYNYYEWPMSDIVPSLYDGWNFLSLPMSDNYKHGEVFFSRGRYDAANRTSTHDRFSYLTVYVDKNNSNDDCTIKIDDLRILRRYYTTGKFGNSLYVPYSEYVKFILSDFNPSQGAVSFYLKSDWVKSMLCNSCLDHRDHTLLRIFSSTSDDLFFLYMTQYGLKFYVTDGNAEVMLTDNSVIPVEADTPTHIGLVWDFTGEFDAPSMGIYINGSLSSSIEYANLYPYGVARFNFVKQALYTLLVGATGWAGLMSYDSSSVDGAVEDLRVYTKPIIPFESIMSGLSSEEYTTPDNLIEISLDNSTYYRVSDSGNGLPLVVTGVAPGASFPVYIRAHSLDSSSVVDYLRTAHITVTRTA